MTFDDAVRAAEKTLATRGAMKDVLRDIPNAFRKENDPISWPEDRWLQHMLTCDLDDPRPVKKKLWDNGLILMLGTIIGMKMGQTE